MLYMQNPFSPVQKAKFTPRESLGAAVVSPQWIPSSRTTATLSSRLNAVALAPTLAADDDEDDNKTLVSFGTATKRFSLNQTIVSPVSQQQFKKHKMSSTVASSNTEQIAFPEKQPLKQPSTEQQQQQRSSYDHRVVPTIPHAHFKTTTQQTSSATIPFHSIVFLSRYNAAATRIQKIARGRAGRLFLEQLQLEAAQKRAILEEEALQKAAVLPLQALVRGWISRRHQREYELLAQLKRIEIRKQRDLQIIEEWKEQQKQILWAQVEAHRAKTDALLRQNDERLAKAKQIIEIIKRDNHTLRENNAALQIAMDQLKEENTVLEREMTRE